MTTTSNDVRTPFTRVFLIEDRAGPENVPIYQGESRAMPPSWAFGALTPIRRPSRNQYGQFEIYDVTRAEQGLPTMTVDARYSYALSEYLRLAKRGCANDVQVHMGSCKNPSDFSGGWEKIAVLEAGYISNWSLDGFGAMTRGDDKPINETVPFEGLDFYEIVPITFAEVAASDVVREIVDIIIADSPACGACGIASDGCQVFVAVQKGAGASPGLPNQVIASRDGGATIIESDITTLATNLDPSALALIGTVIAVVSNADQALHYAPLADIIAGTATWTRVPDGIIAAGAPNDIFSPNGTEAFVVGDAGYIYHSNDVTAGATLQYSTGTAFKAVHGLDNLRLVAVGVANHIAATSNGGATWTELTGPAVGVDLTSVFMRSKLEWFVGAANGKAYYTRDGGASWKEKAGLNSPSSVTDIFFPTPTVGFMATIKAGAGKILRSINGGHSWYTLPEGLGSIPTNQKINAIAACGENVNILYAGGLGASTDGIIVKGE
jgi:photosystem II stability/assembly factor-like uncharacterized protein